MIKLEVGKLHPLYQKLMGTEGARFDCFYCLPTYTIMMPEMQDSEVRAIRIGNAIPAIKNFNQVLMVCLNLGGLWFEAPFNINLSHDPVNFKEYELPNKQTGFLLSIIAVDSATGIIRALRSISLPHNISKKLLLVAKQQYANKAKFNLFDYDKELQSIYNQYNHCTDYLKGISE